MNSVIETIKSRRAIRKYLPEQINDKELNTILEAAIYAPSAHNEQSWHFTVIQNKDAIADLNKSAKEAAKELSQDEAIKQLVFDEDVDIFYGAPTVIVVSGEEKAMMPLIDCVAATENMLIAARSLTIGSCWNGIAAFLFNSNSGMEYAKKLEIPEGYKPYYAIAMGYTDSTPEAPPRRGGTVNFIK
ncbi:Nitroreductase [Peptoclostridium litorale DSM 5388]|uniref:Nitroreductase n=1 Tax=Peptoclostridium litorale DSM 5388 TaxID=1121324 RepID=A0A069RMN3_PEPLI|nr:nitroreductase family protein [Peptoclostridium litorale]KDR95447.1 nitroreductase [Peptoclostridium litorale DSM 5388]SIO18538.1 Nitroreductase [Peptoclostridium litorale DSM 5388]